MIECKEKVDSKSYQIKAAIKSFNKLIDEQGVLTVLFDKVSDRINVHLASKEVYEKFKIPGCIEYEERISADFTEVGFVNGEYKYFYLQKRYE